jgi:hypothetical protein
MLSKLFSFSIPFPSLPSAKQKGMKTNLSVYWILARKSNQIQIKSKSFRILIWILKDFLCQDLDLDLI